MRKDHDAHDESGKDRVKKDRNRIFVHDDNPSAGDQIGEAAGGITGVLAGAALGSAGGPIGTIIGGIAGAVSGWWTGRTIAEAAASFTGTEDTHYRAHYESSPDRLADRKYEDVRPAYQLGHIAGRNPDYAARTFDQVEPELRHGWTDDVRTKHGDWEQVRGYARSAFERARTSPTGEVSAASSIGSGHATTGATSADVSNTVDRESMHHMRFDTPTSPSSPAAGAQGGLGGATTGTGSIGATGSGGSTSDTPTLGSASMGSTASGALGSTSSGAAGGQTGRTQGGSTSGMRAADAERDRMEASSTPEIFPVDHLGIQSTGPRGAGSEAITGLAAAGGLADAETPGHPERTSRKVGGSDMERAGNHLENTGDRIGDKASNAWDATRRGADQLGDKVERAWERTKDEVRDRTDRDRNT